MVEDNIMSSKEICEKIEDEVKQFAKTCIIRPSIAVINVGNNPSNERFCTALENACNKSGIYFRYHYYEDGTPELTIINKIKELDNDDYVNGITVCLPLPEKYNEKRIVNTIINSKDIDGLTDINIGRLISGRKSIMPCAVQGIMELIKNYFIELTGKEIVIVGNSRLIGRPLINVLLSEGATVTICNSNTVDLKKHTLSADMIISCTGVKNLITEDMVKEESIVIDCGYIVCDDGIYGDVDFENVSKKAHLITPINDAVANLTIAMFLKNIVFCYKNKK